MADCGRRFLHSYRARRVARYGCLLGSCCGTCGRPKVSPLSRPNRAAPHGKYGGTYRSTAVARRVVSGTAERRAPRRWSPTYRAAAVARDAASCPRTTVTDAAISATQTPSVQTQRDDQRRLVTAQRPGPGGSPRAAAVRRGPPGRAWLPATAARATPRPVRPPRARRRPATTSPAPGEGGLAGSGQAVYAPDLTMPWRPAACRPPRQQHHVDPHSRSSQAPRRGGMVGHD